MEPFLPLSAFEQRATSSGGRAAPTNAAALFSDTQHRGWLMAQVPDRLARSLKLDEVLYVHKLAESHVVGLLLDADQLPLVGRLSAYRRAIGELELLDVHVGGKGAQTDGDDWAALVNAMEGATGLRFLRICGMALTDEHCAALAEIPSLQNLEILELTNNTIHKDGVEALVGAERFPKLKNLHLGGNPLGSTAMAYLCSCGRLELLNDISALQKTDLDDEALGTLAACEELRKIRVLGLSHNPISKAALRTFAKSAFKDSIVELDASAFPKIKPEDVLTALASETPWPAIETLHVAAPGESIEHLFDTKAFPVLSHAVVSVIPDRETVFRFHKRGVSLSGFDRVQHCDELCRADKEEAGKAQLDKYLAEAPIDDVDRHGHTLLWRACHFPKGRIWMIEHLLEAGADVNASDFSGKTLLFGLRNTEVCELALKNGADPNAQDDQGRTCLFGISDIPMIRLLARKGADISAKDAQGTQPIELLSPTAPASKALVALGAKAPVDPEAAARASKAAPPVEAFVVDSFVTHKKFGRGKVTATAGEGEGAKITVEFDEGGTKVLLSRFLTLVTDS